MTLSVKRSRKDHEGRAMSSPLTLGYNAAYTLIAVEEVRHIKNNGF